MFSSRSLWCLWAETYSIGISCLFTRKWQWGKNYPNQSREVWGVTVLSIELSAPQYRYRMYNFAASSKIARLQYYQPPLTSQNFQKETAPHLIKMMRIFLAGQKNFNFENKFVFSGSDPFRIKWCLRKRVNIRGNNPGGRPGKNIFRF
jgi:hypothetical protein